MPKGVYKRRGRPKGSKNKKTALGQRLIKAAAEAVRHAQGEDVGAKTTTFVFSNDEGWKPQKFTGMQTVNLQPTEPPTFLSRLEAATAKYEQAINDAITALKGQ